MYKIKSGRAGGSLRKNEIVRIWSVLHRCTFTCKVRGVYGPLVELSIGDTILGMASWLIKVKERRLPEPASWLAEEVNYLKRNKITHDCPDCQKILEMKEAELARLEAEGPAAQMIH